MIRRDIVIRFYSLTFSWTALSGFQSTGKTFFSQVALSGFQLTGVQRFFFIPNFCPNLLVRRDALVLPRCVNLSGLLCVVSFDYVRVHKVWQVVAIHGGHDHCPTGEYAFDYKWSFIGRSPFSPGITLW